MALVHRIVSTVRVQDATVQGAPLQGGPVTDHNATRVMANGTGVGQADQGYDALHTIAAGGTLTLDFALGGGLKQQDGSALAMVAMKGLLIRKVDGDGTFSVEIPANGILHMAAAGDKTCTYASDDDLYHFQNRLGVTVTAASADEILINEEGGASTVTLQVTAWGDSA